MACLPTFLLLFLKFFLFFSSHSSQRCCLFPYCGAVTLDYSICMMSQLMVMMRSQFYTPTQLTAVGTVEYCACKLGSFYSCAHRASLLLSYPFFFFSPSFLLSSNPSVWELGFQRVPAYSRQLQNC